VNSSAKDFSSNELQFFLFVGMGGFGVFPSHPLAWIFLVWAVFRLLLGWGSGIFNRKPMKHHVDVDGIRMGKDVAVKVGVALDCYSKARLLPYGLFCRNSLFSRTSDTLATSKSIVFCLHFLKK
jgi:hypothetical protein